jgi:hypothetical protein
MEKRNEADPFGLFGLGGLNNQVQHNPDFHRGVVAWANNTVI